MEAPSFLADCMLGSLARWLRVLGLDTKYFRHAEDDDLLRLALDEDRLLLTKDRPLAARAAADEGLRAHLVVAEGLVEQIAEVLEACTPGFDLDTALTRCSVCNTPLVELSSEEARGRVPPYVARTQDAFRECRRCEKVYWAATHVEGMREKIDAVRRRLAG